MGRPRNTLIDVQMDIERSTGSTVSFVAFVGAGTHETAARLALAALPAYYDQLTGRPDSAKEITSVKVTSVFTRGAPINAGAIPHRVFDMAMKRDNGWFSITPSFEY